MRDQLLLGWKRRQSTLKILRVPEDDGCDQQVEAGGPEELVLKGTIAQLAKTRKKMARAELARRPDPKMSTVAWQ